MAKRNRIGRRGVLRWLGAGLAGTALAACASESTGLLADGGGTDEADAGGGVYDSGTSASEWAVGGTASMTDKASYPDPFTAALSTCAIVASTTEGPCTTATDLLREDVSEGWSGLPVRLVLKVVDGGCAPLVGATVRIWHTNLEGSYSGVTPNPGMCLKESGYASEDFFRGVQTTDAEGVVAFDTCFPGWYSGRAVHVHFQVKNGGTTTRISQLFFPESVTTEIFASHPEYEGYGQPNTTFANDNILASITGADRARLILDVSRMSDGAMLASKVVTVTNG